VELLCEDHLLHFFEGSILHGEKELKRNLIETVESFTGREIQSTKFIYEYSPTAKLNTEVLSNICLLAQTATNRFIAIFAINSKDSIHH
jgi:repressor of nif and glnA expression